MSNAERVQVRGFTRREVLTLGVGVFVVGSMPLAARRAEALVRRTVPVMGTIAEFAVVHREPGKAHAAIDAAMAELERVEALMTWFSDTSEVGRVNRGAGEGPVAVGRETATVVRAALGWAEATGGAFDPAIGRTIRLWDVTHRHTPPAESRVRALAGRSLYRAVDLVTQGRESAIRFADRDVALDLGAIAKGWGVDRAAAALRAAGVAQGLVTVGGDLYALGGARDGEPWRVGIRSPWNPAELAGELAVRDAAVATSGDYLRYFTYHGRRYHHLLDPVSGAPRVTPVRSVTIQAATCFTADAATTAVYGMSSERAASVLRAHAPDARLVRVITGQA